MSDEIHRLDRRVDVVPLDDSSRAPQCGMLTDRAWREIEETIEALDPEVDYGFEASGRECMSSESPAARVHLDGFQHGPFDCDELCCHPELAAIPRVYLHVVNNLEGVVLEMDGEPYVAVAEEACREGSPSSNHQPRPRRARGLVMPRCPPR